MGCKVKTTKYASQIYDNIMVRLVKMLTHDINPRKGFGCCHFITFTSKIIQRRSTAFFKIKFFFIDEAMCFIKVYIVFAQTIEYTLNHIVSVQNILIVRAVENLFSN